MKKLKIIPCATASATTAEFQQALEALTTVFYIKVFSYLALTLLVVYLIYVLDKKVKAMAPRWLGLIFLTVAVFIVLLVGFYDSASHSPYLKRNPDSIDCFDPIVKYLN